MKTFIYSWNRNKSNSTWKFIENSSEARQKAIEEGATDFSIFSFEYEPTTERPNPLRFGDLFIDFDSKKSPFLAIKEMYLFCRYYYEVWDINPKQFIIWLSGGKGCHLQIPAIIFSGEEGDRYLPVLHRELMEKMLSEANLYGLDGRYIDRSLYCLGKGKLIREENIRRPDNDRYKVRIFWDELEKVFESTDVQEQEKKFIELWKLTENPRILTNKEISDNSIQAERNEHLSTLFHDINISIKNQEKINKVICTDFKFSECEFLKHCQDNAATLSEPEWWLMLRILAPLGKTGRELAHEYSKAHPEYSHEKTELKFEHAKQYRCPSCKEIKGIFECSDQCRVKTPLKLLEKNIPPRELVNLYFEVIKDTPEEGLYYHPNPFEEDDFKKKISSYIEVKKFLRDTYSSQWGREIELKDCDNNLHKFVINNEEFAGNCESILRLLYSEGLQLSMEKEARKLLFDYLRCAYTEKRAIKVDKTGWFQKVYLIGDEGIGTDSSCEFIPDYRTNQNLFGKMGSLESWQENVALPCTGHMLAEFAIATAFASLILTPCNFDSFGVHFFNNSSKGKSTLAMVAGSVCGGGGPKGFLRQWRATSNALEGLAVQHNDNLLCLDEISQADSKALYEAIYMLMNDQGKARLKKNIQSQPISTWKILVLSNGEKTIGDKISEDKYREQMAGQSVRIIDIDADAGYGVYSYQPEDIDLASFSDNLKAASMQNYGYACRAFLEQFTQDYEASVQRIQKIAQEFQEKNTNSNYSGQVKRVIKSLSAVVAAGELAIEFGILPWKKGAVTQATSYVLEKWISQRGGTGDLEIEKFLSRVREFFRREENRRFKRAYCSTEDIHFYNSRITNHAGYRWIDKNGKELFLVISEVFTKEMLQGLKREVAIKVLIENNMIVTTKTGGPKETIAIDIEGEKLTIRGMIFIPSNWMSEEDKVLFTEEDLIHINKKNKRLEDKKEKIEYLGNVSDGDIY